MIRYTYDREILTMTNQFLNTISDIVVGRFNAHKQVRDQIKVRVLYAPKQRILHDLLNRDQTLTLPAISVQIAGVSRDPQRVTNKLMGSYFNPSQYKSQLAYDKTPLPVDVRYNVSILTKYQEDVDQILTNITPYINPYFVVSWRTPRRPDHEIRSRVLWDGNINVSYPVELNSTTVARVIADLSFTLKGWLFQAGPFETNQVHDINMSFTPSSVLDEKFLFDIDKNSETTDYISYSVPPKPKFVFPYTATTFQTKTFQLLGSGFEKAINVYLSGYPVRKTSTTFNPFGNYYNLSADNPPFFATKLLTSDWTYDQDSLITFNLPTLSCEGLLDIIVESPAGYGVLTQNVNTKLHAQLPFLSGLPVYHLGPPLPALSGFILQENGAFYLLQENGFKINLDFALNNC